MLEEEHQFTSNFQKSKLQPSIKKSFWPKQNQKDYV